MKINPLYPKRPRLTGICACGCGEALPPAVERSPFKAGHYMRVTPHNKGKSKYQIGDKRNWQGYVQVYEPLHPLASQGHGRGWVFEHRKIVYDSGFPLEHKDHVHHINGNKSDNRLENLKALSLSIHQHLHGLERQGWQPRRDRIAIVVAWAHEILSKYGHRYPAI